MKSWSLILHIMIKTWIEESVICLILCLITICLFTREYASQRVILVDRVKHICIYIKSVTNLNIANWFLLVCPEKPNVLAIVLGVLAGLVVLGILVVLGVKFGIDYRDYRIYQAFLEEVKNAKWEEVCSLSDQSIVGEILF